MSQGRVVELLSELESASGPPVDSETAAPHAARAMADTIPSAPAPLTSAARLDEDAAWRDLLAAVNERAAALAANSWDNLAHVEAFARAAVLAREVGARFTDPFDRRAMAHALWPLLPPPARSRPFLPLPRAVAARAPAFPIVPGDVPRIAPAWSAFLGSAGPSAAAAKDPLERVCHAGAGPLLVPRSLCPAAARGTATAVILESAADGARGARAYVPASMWTGREGERYDVRTGADGKALLTVEGREQPIEVTASVLGAWLFSAGPDARGLDLRSPDDRALLLTWAHLLRGRLVDGREAFAWLEEPDVPPATRALVVTACVEAAVEAVASHTVDPNACRIVLRPHEADGGWPQRAAALLDDAALFRDVSPRRRAPGDAGFARDIVWLDALLPTGFVAGRLSPVAAGRAFARLATSVLAPLGVFPLSGMKDGSGGVLLQRLLPPSDERPAGEAGDGQGALAVDVPTYVDFGARPAACSLWQAWREGRALALPDPRGAPRHDVEQMPAWLSLFLEGVGAR
jgi:hypothetical protein